MAFCIQDEIKMKQIMLLPKVQKVCTGLPYYHSMLSFAHEQCGEAEEAAKEAHKALKAFPSDVWAHHAVAHAYLAKGRILDGLAFMLEQSG